MKRSKMSPHFLFANTMAETNTGTTAAQSKRLPVEDHLHIWFEKNRKLIVLICAAVILAALAFIFWYWNRSTAESEAATAFAKANGIPEWEMIVAKYPGSKVAPRAL